MFYVAIASNLINPLAIGMLSDYSEISRYNLIEKRMNLLRESESLGILRDVNLLISEENIPGRRLSYGRYKGLLIRYSVGYQEKVRTRNGVKWSTVTEYWYFTEGDFEHDQTLEVFKD